MNFIPKEAFPYKTPVGSTYDSGDPAGEFEQALEKSDWDGLNRAGASRLPMESSVESAAPVLRALWAGALPKEEAMIRFGSSGNAMLYVHAGPSGQGHETVLPEVVGDPRFACRGNHLEASDPGGPALVGAGTVGSRSMMSHGGALAATAKGDQEGARPRRAGARGITERRGVQRRQIPGEGHRRVDAVPRSRAPLRSGARHQGRDPDADRVSRRRAHREVEIDRDTGEVDLLRYVAVDDCGRILNHVLLDGQLHGGIVQGLGQVFAEHVQYDARTASSSPARSWTTPCRVPGS